MALTENGMDTTMLVSPTGGYSRDDAKEDFIEEIEELMEKAPDMETRQKFERFISKMR